MMAFWARCSRKRLSLSVALASVAVVVVMLLWSDVARSIVGYKMSEMNDLLHGFSFHTESFIKKTGEFRSNTSSASSRSEHAHYRNMPSVNGKKWTDDEASDDLIREPSDMRRKRPSEQGGYQNTHTRESQKMNGDAEGISEFKDLSRLNNTDHNNPGDVTARENVQKPTEEKLPGQMTVTGALERLPENDGAVRGSGGQIRDPKVTSQGKSETHHVLFLKVHKAASSTVQNIMFRFALSRRLLVMVPREGHILSQDTTQWESRAIPLPPGVARFDIVCNHLIFNDNIIRRNLYPDTIYIGVVRHPLDRFVSAFNYYKNKYQVPYLVTIPGKDPIATYLENPAFWDKPKGYVSVTRNRMSFDFGMDRNDVNDPVAAGKYIDYLQQTFDLVLVSERFDESMVLMKRLLGWSTKDVVYLKINTFKGSSKSHVFTEKEKLAHRLFNVADYALYERFVQIFDEKVRAQGRKFAEEVADYRDILAQVAAFCGERAAKVLSVKATEWSGSFAVTESECDMMSLSETRLVEIVRNEQEQRLKQQ